MTVTLQHPRYHFDHWIAAGGMGEVWQATDTLLDREVAVKVLRRELAQDPVLRQRFAAEARHAGSLQHRHVASVLDYGEITADGHTPQPFLVMELVEGQPLSALLTGGQALAPALAADLIAQAAEGIEAAHALGIVHRDVKPGNLLVTADGQVKVTDFGVARAADAASLTLTGHLIGTPHYLSPEQAEGRTATPVSDVYALGIVLFECLTGRKPFAGESPVATAVMQIREPLPAFPAGVPDRLQRIVQVATAKDPTARFRSAGAMAAALRDESPETRTFLFPTPAARTTVASDPQTHRLWSGRRVLAGLVTVLLLSGAAWVAVSAADEPAREPGAATADAGATDEGKAEEVRVRADDYVGRPVGAAVRDLEELGLRTDVETRANPGQESAGTVAAVSPTGLLEPGTRVLVTVWGERPAPPAPSGSGDGSAAPGGKPGQAGPDGGPGGTGGPGGGQGNGPGAKGGSQGGTKSGPKSGAGGPGKAPGHSNQGGNKGGNKGGGGKPGKGSSGKGKR